MTPAPPYVPKSQSAVTQTLYKEYNKWKETPYSYGGKNVKGIDCSALVQVIYKEAFGIKMPRTTVAQLKKGRKVDQKNLKEGDLVFFKIGRNEKHAGIVIEKGLFLHSSTTYGVRVSKLSNPYWKNRFSQARRVLSEQKIKSLAVVL